MPPKGISKRGEVVTDQDEELIRRGRRVKNQKCFVMDQITGKLRPPAAIFEPRLPENRPNAKRWDKFLSVNIVSSLQSDGLLPDWRGNDLEFYSAKLDVRTCNGLKLSVTWEPDTGRPNPIDDNPHHGGIYGVVELFYASPEAYEVTITKLAKAAEILPECFLNLSS